MLGGAWLAGALVLSSSAQAQDDGRYDTEAFLGNTRLRGFGLSAGVRFGMVRPSGGFDPMNWDSLAARGFMVAPRVSMWSEIGNNISYATLGVSFQPGEQPDDVFLLNVLRNTQVEGGLNVDLYDFDVGVRAGVSLFPGSNWRPSYGVRLASVPPPELNQSSHPGAEILAYVTDQGLPQIAFSAIWDTPYLVPAIDAYRDWRDPSGGENPYGRAVAD